MRRSPFTCSFLRTSMKSSYNDVTLVPVLVIRFRQVRRMSSSCGLPKCKTANYASGRGTTDSCSHKWVVRVSVHCSFGLGERIVRVTATEVTPFTSDMGSVNHRMALNIHLRSVNRIVDAHRTYFGIETPQRFSLQTRGDNITRHSRRRL